MLDCYSRAQPSGMAQGSERTLKTAQPTPPLLRWRSCLEGLAVRRPSRGPGEAGSGRLPSASSARAGRLQPEPSRMERVLQKENNLRPPVIILAIRSTVVPQNIGNCLSPCVRRLLKHYTRIIKW